MRLRRLSFLAGWAAVLLLAVAGFAAFGNPNPTTEEIRIEAAAASIGHTSGAYAGLAFALIGDPEDSGLELDVPEGYLDPDPASLTKRSDPEATVRRPERNAGTIASASSGWLSEVEVRALVSLYFEPQDVNRAVRVAWCESRFDPNMTNPRSGGVGLFQHLPQYWEERAANAGFGGFSAKDAEASTAAAAWTVYSGGGWDIFNCRG